ncbi:MAG: methylenetetrahydrofolate reductase [Pseudomonadota bacterium]|nr:methylenetetrahydrofolate reductase [Pseudomonadota bacterium]
MGTQFIPSDITFSLEVFPPKTETGLSKLLDTVNAYVALKPSRITVTCGAGGASESIGHMRTVTGQIAHRSQVPVAAHITCAGRSRTDVDSILAGFWADGVRHVVALRGDILGQHGPYAPHPDGYLYTGDFIASIRRQYPAMGIAVAGYPETHPESPTEAFDLDHLKRKIDAGADSVLTQFFFDPEIFLRWRDKVAARGIDVPLTPGLLPILSFPRMLSFAQKCNANVPEFLHTMFGGVDPDSTDHKLLAMNVLSHQITRLVEHGVKSFHFYTLNDTLLTKHLCTWMRAGL